ncbi:MAG: response regulator transcription factor [Clostridiaceae bacterium]|nr:response regulator transcription factor [Clostridiaceae bacterium]
MINVLMVDDHKAILSGAKILLESHGMNVTTCFSGESALNILRERSFDVMIFDLKMPGMNGLELTKRTLEIHPEAIIIILSGENIADNFDLLIEAGVSSIIDKSCSDSQLITGIQMALEKMMLLPLDLVRKLTLSKAQDKNSYDNFEEVLTQLEMEILVKAASGMTNKEIADSLQMVQRNVEYHLSHIYKKLKVTSRVNAIRRALQLNIIKNNIV